MFPIQCRQPMHPPTGCSVPFIITQNRYFASWNLSSRVPLSGATQMLIHVCDLVFRSDESGCQEKIPPYPRRGKIDLGAYKVQFQACTSLLQSGRRCQKRIWGDAQPHDILLDQDVVADQASRQAATGDRREDEKDGPSAHLSQPYRQLSLRIGQPLAGLPDPTYL